MKIHPFIICTAFACLVIQGCNRNRKLEEQRLSWSTDAPLSMPFRARLQRFEKKNLVRNFSFESGKIFVIDSTRSSFSVEGWQQVGSVEWVDTRYDSLYRPDEALSGWHSVKISRKQAYETDEKGDGIISEFIKVIPGNYSFSFYTRLENIAPPRARLGIRMYDAVEARILFYDKNKLALNSTKAFPQINQFVDNSFKSLSLANFATIGTFPWGKIIGKSANFPYPEGDIPSEAHYVKLFIGLKGTGTMWIDSVDFRYTSGNFSLAERMIHYSDTAVLMHHSLIPTPKFVQKMGSVRYLAGSGNPESHPVIVVPPDAGESTMQAANLIRDALSKGYTRNGASGMLLPEIVRVCPEIAKEEARLVFNVGKTSLYDKHADDFPIQEIAGKSQGYFIYSLPDYPNLVFLDGNSDAAIYYAALTAVQLFDTKQPVFHNARVIDYPDFENRYFTFGNATTEAEADRLLAIVNELAKFKLNGAFFAPELLLPSDSSLSYNYPVGFEGGVISTLLPVAAIPTSRVQLFIHPVFNNQLLDYSAYSDKTLTTNGISLAYSGSSFFSINTDDADFYRFYIFSGSKPVFMDNSMQVSTPWGHYGGGYPYYPGKIRLYNIFEPFSNIEIRHHLNKVDAFLYYMNFKAGSEFDIVRMATAADFMWNTSAYNPESSLWKVLHSRYGDEVARELLNYADKYGLALELMLKVEFKEQASRNLKNAQVVSGELVALSNHIEKKLGPAHPLMQDLIFLNKQVKKRVNGLQVSLLK